MTKRTSDRQSLILVLTYEGRLSDPFVVQLGVVQQHGAHVGVEFHHHTNVPDGGGRKHVRSCIHSNIRGFEIKTVQDEFLQIVSLNLISVMVAV